MPIITIYKDPYRAFLMLFIDLLVVTVLCKPIKNEFLSIKSAFFKSLLIFKSYNLIAG